MSTSLPDEDVKVKINNVETEIKEVKVKINKVEEEIKEVKEEIKEVKEKINKVEQEIRDTRSDKEKEQLRKEKEQLREEKNKLLDKENKLLDKENQLRGMLAALAQPPQGKPQAHVYCLRMKLWNSRAFPGVRREVYQILAQSGAYYPINKDDSVRYDGKTLCIQALTLSKSDASKALGTISVLIQQRMNRFPGQIRIDHAVIEPSEAAITCWETILATHYLPDANEDSSPQETASDSCSSAPDEQLIQLQSIEKGRPRYLQKAHLISKDRLRRPPLSKLNKNLSNFLALTPTVHAWFDGVNVTGGEGIAIRYEGVTQDQPPKVTLRVIPVDDIIAQGLVSTLRDFTATTDAPRGYFVNVHVSDPSLFRVCLTWKYNKTVKAWVDHGCAPEGATRVNDYNFGLLAERIGENHGLEEE